MRTTSAPRSTASLNSGLVPKPGSKSTAIFAALQTSLAALISSISEVRENPYWIDDPPRPSPCEISMTGTPALSRACATA